MGRREDLQLSVAGDGAQALHLARTAQPDVILLDVKLPSLDGVQVCRFLKGDDATRDIKIIMVTALAQESDRRNAIEAGADDYVTKPFSPTDLLRRVKAVLEAGNCHA